MKPIRELVKEFPPIEKVRHIRYRRAFFAGDGGWPRFYGLFDSRMEAEAAAANGSEIVGYDYPEMAQDFLETMTRTWMADYPVLFWLSKLVRDHDGLFDLGGHVGTKYRAWRTKLDLPENFTWTVCDLPSIVEVGQEMSADLPQLKFTVNREDANAKGILITSGALQYANFDIADALDGLTEKPPHIFLNKVPSHQRPDVYTLENLPKSSVPYRIFDEEKLLKSLTDLGYEVVDRWMVPKSESSVRVPFTDLGTPVHLGFYLRSVEQTTD